jgi:hypothetical protein
MQKNRNKDETLGGFARVAQRIVLRQKRSGAAGKNTALLLSFNSFLPLLLIFIPTHPVLLHSPSGREFLVFLPYPVPTFMAFEAYLLGVVAR